MSSNLPLYRNFGDDVRNLSPVLANQLSQMYIDIANALSQTIKRNVISGSNPPANDQSNSFFSIGDITVRADTNTAWIMTNRTTPTAVTWTQIT